VQNCILIQLWDFAPRMCEVAYQMFTRLVFWVLPTRYPQGRCADFDVQYAKRRPFVQECGFWGPKNKILDV